MTRAQDAEKWLRERWGDSWDEVSPGVREQTVEELSDFAAARCAQLEADKQDEIDAAVVEAVSAWVEKFEAAGCTVSGFVVTNKRAVAAEAELVKMREKMIRET
jgi:hypothetical protein